MAAVLVEMEERRALVERTFLDQWLTLQKHRDPHRAEGCSNILLYLVKVVFAVAQNAQEAESLRAHICVMRASSLQAMRIVDRRNACTKHRQGFGP